MTLMQWIELQHKQATEVLVIRGAGEAELQIHPMEKASLDFYREIWTRDYYHWQSLAGYRSKADRTLPTRRLRAGVR